jgi:hypothetical protein
VPVEVMTHWRLEDDPPTGACRLLPVGQVVVVADDGVVPRNAVEIPTPETVAITTATVNATVRRRYLVECKSFIRRTVTTTSYPNPSNGTRKCNFLVTTLRSGERRAGASTTLIATKRARTTLLNRKHDEGAVQFDGVASDAPSARIFTTSDGGTTFWSDGHSVRRATASTALKVVTDNGRRVRDSTCRAPTATDTIAPSRLRSRFKNAQNADPSVSSDRSATFPSCFS